MERVTHLGEYGYFSVTRLAHGGYAFLRSLLLYGNIGMGSSTRVYLADASWPGVAAFVLFYLFALVIALAPIAVLFRDRQRVARGDRLVLTALALWAAQHAVFAVWWVPADLSFWVQVLIAWWIATAIAVKTILPDGSGANEAPSKEGRGALRILAAFTVALFVWNGAALMFPNRDPSTNQRLQAAHWLARNTNPGDVVVTQDSVDGFYVRYFGHRTVREGVREGLRIVSKRDRGSGPGDPAPRLFLLLLAAHPIDGIHWQRDESWNISGYSLWRWEEAS